MNSKNLDSKIFELKDEIIKSVGEVLPVESFTLDTEFPIINGETYAKSTKNLHIVASAIVKLAN
jgi:hypothetical protein